MRSVQLARTALKSSTTPLPFLVPAFTTSITIPSSRSAFDQAARTRSLPSNRQFSTSSSKQAAFEESDRETTAKRSGPQAEKAGERNSSSAAGARQAPSKPLQDVSDELASIFSSGSSGGSNNNNGRSRRNAASPAGHALQDAQGSIASSMGLSEIYNRKPGSSSLFFGDDIGSSNISVPPPPLPVRLDAYVGRSVAVHRNRSLAAAMRLLDIKCAQNRVKADANYQRFHERPGLKRKRLKSQRWRKRFKEGFKATVAKVIRMRNMGW